MEAGIAKAAAYSRRDRDAALTGRVTVAAFMPIGLKSTTGEYAGGIF
jgi:hypothetical protein